MKTRILMVNFMAVGACALACLVSSSTSFAANLPAVHWINDASQNAASVLNSGGTFVTDWKATHDVTVTAQGDIPLLYMEQFGPANPDGVGNNPAYITGFIGDSAAGTGNGQIGGWSVLVGRDNAILQFDFADPFAWNDRLLVSDVDGLEAWQITAFVKNSDSSYAQAAVAHWTVTNYSGQTGVTPDASWPAWDPDTGTLTSLAGGQNLNEPLVVLAPDQAVDRVILTKTSSWYGAGTGFQFVHVPEPASSVPVPATMLLFVSGLLGLVGMRKRSK